MTLDKQITIGFLVMLLIIIIVSVFCIYSINKLTHTKSAIGDKEYTLSEIISGFTDDENGDGDVHLGDIFTRKNLFDAIKITDEQISLAYFNVLVVATLAILFGGGLTIMFPKRVTKPILKLVDAAINVREGDYSYRVESIKGTDEIATLVSSFNKMLGNIEREHEELEQKNAELKEKNDLNEKLLDETRKFNTVLEDKIREVQEDLEIKHQQLLRAEKLSTIGEIATRIAHEIRNPLSGIAVALENLSTDLQSSGQDARVSEIISEVDRLDNIINELFQLALPREVTLVRGKPNELIERVVKLLSLRAQSKGIQIVKQLSESSKEINLDFELIEQVLLNITINAIEAIKKPDGIITIKTYYSDDDYIIEIADTGMGINKINIERIFEPFFSMKKDGTGLGLAISKRSVEIHRGTIIVESREGEGSKFTITLPTDIKEEEIIDKFRPV